MFPLAHRYAAFLDGVFQGLAEPHLPGWEEPVTELDLQSLWFAGEFGADFLSTEGQRIQIRDFGTWNHSAGPDFIGCAFLRDGQPVRGDIELDPDVRDWERHGHGANEAYENVVLHIFVHAPEGVEVFTRTRNHREIPRVQIRPDMLAGGTKPRRMAEARLGRCAAPLAEMAEAQVRSLLESAAQFRLQRKAEKLAALIRIHGREQAIYQGLSTTLGYRPNARPFTVLAQRLPLRTLLRESALEREARLFGCSGFLDGITYEETAGATRVYLRELWSEWWKVRAGYVHWLDEPERLHWQIAGARPGNHPQRRLGALCALLRKWKSVTACLHSAQSWSRRGFHEALLDLQHDYWSTQYTLKSAPSAKPLSLIGDTRIQEMLANLCYPLLTPERTELWEEYKTLPSVLDNQKVRRATLRLFGEAPLAKKMQKHLFHQQGLLQVYEDYCLEDDSACSECPFPEKLREWS